MTDICSKPYCPWRILVQDDFITPITKDLLNSIYSIIEDSWIIAEIDEDKKYKSSIYKEIDLIIVYDLEHLNNIPSLYKGKIVVHSLKRINKLFLKRKGFKIIKSFEYTGIAKYRDLGMFIYYLEGKPWYLKNSDLNCNELTELYEVFSKNNCLKIANYYTTLILGRS